MAKRPNTLARILIPLGLFLAGLGVVVAVAVNTGRGRTPQPQTPAPAQGGVAEAPGGAEQAPGGGQPAEPVEPESGAQPAAEEQVPARPAPGLHAESLAGDPLATNFAPLGGLGFESPYELRVEFSHIGAGVESIRLARKLDSVRADRAAKQGVIDPERHVAVQEQVAAGERIIVPLAALGVEIEGAFVPLTTAAGGAPAWRQVAPERAGVFEAFVADGSGRRVLRVERVYTLEPGSHDLKVSQRLENLTDTPMRVRWRQFGPSELFADSGYGGEKRRVRFGYLPSPGEDPTRQWVGSGEFLWPRSKFVDGRGLPAGEKEFPGGKIWPNARAEQRGYELVWAGMTNRYFAAVAHPLIDPDSPAPDKAFRAVERIDRVTLPGGNAMIMSFYGPEETLPAGGGATSAMGVYAGPLSKDVIGGDPVLAALGVGGIVVYNFGGPCAWCTFTWLTAPLLGLLRVLHSLTSDWALAIILLVVCVRTLLHPVTRWSQIRMQIFGKQMQGMAPKQKVIQEKYKDDRQRMQQEMAKLWREEGVSPAGFLGCLPMFLQSPVWIALYATLYFAVELRHEPAFFGVFQRLTGNAWPFLADLAEPDRALYFGRNGITVPLMGEINSINLLPLLLGVVFYIQQKYLTPPTTGAMTPEQESQQKMMKIMMVVMFPLIMYGAPSGLALYFITNSTLGILESRWIRKHVETSGLLDPERLKKKPGQGGFMARLKQLAEEQQRQQAQRGTSPKRQPRLPGRDQGPGAQRRFKKR
ncbi:MAG TPA: membrane protein insertase YidC [Phycisphaerales bacterium]|nr:membrane protein insertase YidC [Phycisphaerales bacterium]